jgi:hypothetical protein
VSDDPSLLSQSDPDRFDLSQTRRDGVRVRNLARGGYKEEVRGYVGTGK